MSDTYDKKRAVASKMMGSYSKKPVTPSDKKMSEKHLKHRAKVDEANKSGDKEKALKLSVKYNIEHKSEHAEALEDAKKQLAKLKK